MFATRDIGARNYHSALRFGLLDIDVNAKPLTLVESDDAQYTTRYVTGKDRDPDIERLEGAGLLD